MCLCILNPYQEVWNVLVCSEYLPSVVGGALVCFAFIPEMVEGVFLHAIPPEMASLPREREKNKQLQASYFHCPENNTKVFSSQFPFFGVRRRRRRGTFLSCDVCYCTVQ